MMEEEILSQDEQQIDPSRISEQNSHSVVGKLLVPGCKTWAWHQTHPLLVHGNKWVSVLIDILL